MIYIMRQLPHFGDEGEVEDDSGILSAIEAHI